MHETLNQQEHLNLTDLIPFCCFFFVTRATTVRSKGRNLRIKAPMCRALKKLCDPDGEYVRAHTDDQHILHVQNKQTSVLNIQSAVMARHRDCGGVVFC